MCVWFVCPDDLFMQIANPPGNKVNASFALWRCILLSKQLPWTFLPSKEGKGLPLGVQQTQVVLGEGPACLQAENLEPDRGFRSPVLRPRASTSFSPGVLSWPCRRPSGQDSSREDIPTVHRGLFERPSHTTGPHLTAAPHVPH